MFMKELMLTWGSDELGSDAGVFFCRTGQGRYLTRPSCLLGQAMVAIQSRSWNTHGFVAHITRRNNYDYWLHELRDRLHQSQHRCWYTLNELQCATFSKKHNKDIRKAHSPLATSNARTRAKIRLLIFLLKCKLNTQSDTTHKADLTQKQTHTVNHNVLRNISPSSVQLIKLAFYFLLIPM